MITPARTIGLLGVIGDMLQMPYLRGQNATKSRTVHKLPFPYNLMGRLMTPNRFMSIICASANNEISHRERYYGFRDRFSP